MRLTFIDFETATGQRASPCALGITVLDGASVVERKSWLIRPPGNAYSGFNIGIHGITPKMTEHEPEFDELWPEIRPYIGLDAVVAHNASFDMSVLRNTLDLYGLGYPEAAYYCTLVLGKAVMEGRPSYRLDSLCLSFGITFQHHDASADAWAASQLYLRFLAIAGAQDVKHLAQTHGITPGGLHSHGGYTPCRRRCA